MNDVVQPFLQSGPVQAIAGLVLAFLLFIIVYLLPICGVTYLIYFLVTLPMRRNERARTFLDLLELGLKAGRSPEVAVTDAAASRDQSLGVRFHLLAAHLETGLRLSAALERVPRLLPSQVAAMLKTGERIGDVSKVLPACRQLLRDGVSHVRGALNYIILLAFVITPFTVFMPLMMKVRVFPAYQAVFAGMSEGRGLPAFTRLVFGSGGFFLGVQLAFLGGLWFAMIGYLGGPRLYGWASRRLPGFPDWLVCRLPWRQKRLQRDFSTMLALLLDAEVPEAEAVTLAAQATGNTVIERRAATTTALLKEGVKLPDAIRAMDDSGEFHWRLANALRPGRGFIRALTGWHEALDAKAFQLEQTAAQVTTTCLVLANGLIVASIVIAVFLALIQLINEATLW